MQWFAFGDQREVITRSGETKVVGEYALHVQCPWRIVRGDEIVVGSRDLRRDGAHTRRDRRIDEMLGGKTGSLAGDSSGRTQTRLLSSWPAPR